MCQMIRQGYVEIKKNQWKSKDRNLRFVSYKASAKGVKSSFEKNVDVFGIMN